MVEKFKIEKGVQLAQSMKRTAPQPPPIAMASSLPPGAPSTPTPQRHQPSQGESRGSPSLRRNSSMYIWKVHKCDNVV